MNNVFTCATRGRDPLNPSDRTHPSNGRFSQRLEVGLHNISNTLTSVANYFEYT